MFRFIFPKEILIIVTHHNLWGTTQRCLNSIRDYTDLTNVSLVVVDDFSDDPISIQWFNDLKEYKIRINSNLQHNAIIGKFLEFTKDNPNVKYVVALNNDTLFTKNWLRNMILCMEKDLNIAVMGSKDNMDYHSYQNFPVPNEVKPEMVGPSIIGDNTKLQEYIDREFYAKRKSDAYVSTQTIDGVVMLFRNSLINEIGTINPEFYEYAGDSEFFIRTINKGYKVAYCLSSFVYHLGGGGGGKYEAFLKYHDHSLGESATKATELLLQRYKIDIGSHGRSHLANRDEIANIERELVEL